MYQWTRKVNFKRHKRNFIFSVNWPPTATWERLLLLLLLLLFYFLSLQSNTYTLHAYKGKTRLTPLGSYFFNITFWGGYSGGELIFQCHLFTSDVTKFIWNLCKTKLFTWKKKTRPMVCMTSCPGSCSREELFFWSRCREGGVNRYSRGELFKEIR